MVAPKRDTSGGNMVPTMVNPKQKRPVDNFSPKYHFNPSFIDRDMVNGMDGRNIQVLGGCVDETIVYLRNEIQVAELCFQRWKIRNKHEQ